MLHYEMKRLFLALIRWIAKLNPESGFYHHALIMGKGIKALLAMVATHPTHPHSSKGEFR